MPVMDKSLDQLLKERRSLTLKLRSVQKAIDNKHVELRKAYDTQAKDMKQTLKAVRSTLVRSMKTVRSSIKASSARIQLEEVIRKNKAVGFRRRL